MIRLGTSDEALDPIGLCFRRGGASAPEAPEGEETQQRAAVNRRIELVRQRRSGAHVGIKSASSICASRELGALAWYVLVNTERKCKVRSISPCSCGEGDLRLTDEGRTDERCLSQLCAHDVPELDAEARGWCPGSTKS